MCPRAALDDAWQRPQSRPCRLIRATPCILPTRRPAHLGDEAPSGKKLLPELREMEAGRRALDEPVRAFPVEQAGPAHVATLKTFDPPLATLEGRRFKGAARLGKRLLFPTEDGELVLLVHLMTAGRLRYLAPGEKGPKAPAFRLRFEAGAELMLTEAGSKKRAGVWLLTPEAAEEELAHLGPEALGLGAGALGEILASDSRRLHSLLRDQRAVAGIGFFFQAEDGIRDVAVTGVQTCALPI